MAKRTLKSKVPVNDYMTVHPALDFWLGGAIVAVGAKWQLTYENSDVDFVTRPLCILSDGERFEYSKKELATRKLYHTGYLEIPSGRWDFADIDEFGQKLTAHTIAYMQKQVREQVEHYLGCLDERQYDLFACFIIYTYFYPLFNGAPILQLWGEFQTGKTKVCSLLEAMCFNPINSANISSSSVFRLVESRRATVLLDESEELSTADRTKDIRNMLLAGTGKSGETFRQERQLDDSYRTQSFKVFSPKVIANIAGISIPALQSRVVRIVTTGTPDKVKRSREVEQENERWQNIRNQLYRVCLRRYEEVIESRYHLPRHELTGRTLLMWQGLLAIANLCDREVWKAVLSYAHDNKDALDGEIEEEASRPKQILGSLIKLVDGHETGASYSPDELLQHLAREVEVTSKRDLGIMLGRLGIRSRVTSKDGSSYRCYNLYPPKLRALYDSR